MRVLFDKNVPYGTRHFLPNHQVETVDDHGWSRISNGELLKTAEASGFEVVVTADQNILYQQTLVGRKIALVVFGSNIWPIVRNYAATIKERVDAAVPGSYAFIEMLLPPKKSVRQKRFECKLCCPAVPCHIKEISSGPNCI